jgi:hypothetical protein
MIGTIGVVALEIPVVVTPEVLVEVVPVAEMLPPLLFACPFSGGGITASTTSLLTLSPISP